MSSYRFIAGRYRRVNGYRFGVPTTSPVIPATAPATGGAIMVPHGIIPPVADQGQEGSCVYQALRELYVSLGLRLSPPNPRQRSVQAPYYWGRELQGDAPTDDSGSSNAIAMQVASTRGVPYVETWPDDRPMSMTPDRATEIEAGQHKSILSFYLPNLAMMRACLAQGFGFALAFDCQDQLFTEECSQSGLVEYSDDPNAFTGDGHDISVWGHDPNRQVGSNVGALWCLNHWSESFGVDGFFWLADKYVHAGHAREAETIRMVEESK